MKTQTKTRKLTRTGDGSMTIVIPASEIAALGWREHQKLSVKRVAGSIVIRDARTKRNKNKSNAR